MDFGLRHTWVLAKALPAIKMGSANDFLSWIFKDPLPRRDQPFLSSQINTDKLQLVWKEVTLSHQVREESQAGL